MLKLTQDLFEGEIFPHLSNSEILNLTQTCKPLFKLDSILQNRITNRLAHIFTPIFNLNRTIIHKLSQIGVIAGGSMVYALNEFVDKSSVSDIDVYLPTKSAFMEAVNVLVETGEQCSFNTMSSVQYGGEPNPDEDNPDISILNVKINSINAIYQLIYFEFESAFDVIRSFDLDFVQVGWYQGKVFRTKACITSHIAKQVLRGYHVPRKNRIDKAILKGFSALPIGKEFKAIESYKFIQIDDLNELNLIPFSPRKSIGEFFFDQLEVVKLEKTTVLPLFRNRLGGNNITFSIDIFYLINNKECKTETIPIEIDVIQYNPSYHSVHITPIVINPNFSVTYCSTTLPFVPGKHVVNARFRYNSNPSLTGQPRINIKIEKILSRCARPVPLSKNLIVNM